MTAEGAMQTRFERPNALLCICRRTIQKDEANDSFVSQTTIFLPISILHPKMQMLLAHHRCLPDHEVLNSRVINEIANLSKQMLKMLIGANNLFCVVVAEDF